jgi:hypothetical protein
MSVPATPSSPGGAHTARARLSAVLGAIAGLALVLALVAGYVHDVAASPDQFADRATSALTAPPVRSLVAQRVTDDLVIRHAGELLAARPLIQSAVAAAIGGRAFSDLFRTGVRDLHRAAVSGDQNTVTLTVADAGTLAASGLDLVRPSLAKKLRVEDRVQLFRDHVAQAGAVLVRVAARARLTTILLGVIALLASVGSVLLARDRRRAFSGLGVAVAVAGLLLVVAWQVGSVLVAHSVSAGEDRAAAEAVYRAFFGDLRLEAWVVAALGAVLAAAAVSVVRPAAVEERMRRLVVLILGEPNRRWERAVRGLVLVGLGALCLLDVGAIVTLLVTGLGIALIYRGTTTLLGLIHELVGPRGTDGQAADARTATARPVTLLRERIPARRVALAAVAVAVCLGAAVGGLLGSDALQASGPSPAPCDGSRMLCTRSLSDITLAATHNAMSAPLPGWYAAEQETGIPGQLQDGIRGLLIDTHEAVRLANGRLRTVLGGPYAGGPLHDVSAQTRRAAERLRERVGFRGSGPRSLYLCHGFCELGGTPLATVLGQIDDYLVAHPQQVLVIINEDYVAPRAFVNAVDRSGLGKLAYRGSTTGRWPTLSRMISSGGRVVFLAENHAGAAPWYHLAYKRILEETPYAFSKASQLTEPAQLARSCRPGRGPKSGAPLFLVNNWVSTDPVPLAANAAKVNATAPLLRRLRTCERRRDHLPNLVAVNFFRAGGLMQAVDALNGVPASATP